MRTVIILGTGATIGSGYTKDKEPLPGDRNFFGNQTVKNLISQYPALKIMLRFFRKESGDDLDGVGLEEVWTFLEFCSKGAYKEIYDLKKEKEEWRNWIRRPDSERGNEHCDCKKFRKDQTIPPAIDEIDLALLAGWDLRGLLNEIYGWISSPSENIYQRFLKKFNIPSDDTTTFISLNYDTVLEHALDRIQIPDRWFYAHVQMDVPRNPDGIQVLKPHGSLNWLFRGNKPDVLISTNYQLEPVQNRSFKTNIFEQAMIVLPTQLKQELNIESTQDKVTTDLFTKIWKSMADVLAKANRVFIIGYSFPSTDHHFRTLMRQVNIRRGDEKYEEVYCCTFAKRDNMESLMEEQSLAVQTIKNAQLFFPTLLSNFHDCKGGFEDFVK